MWKHIKRVVTVGVGTGLIALSSRSMPAAIIDADGYLVTNLKWMGWHNPPSALASTTADHWVAAVGVVLIILMVVVLILSRFERRKKASLPATYITPKEAIRYLADDTIWAWKIRRKRTPGLVQDKPMVMRHNARFEALEEFQTQAAREGTQLKIYGTKIGSAKAVPLPHIFWMTNGLDGTRVFSEVECLTQPTTYAQNPDIYGDLKVDRGGVFATWPRMGILRTAITKIAERRDWKRLEKL